MTRDELRHQCDRTMEAFLGHLDAGGRLAILKAPPGSGKTHTLMRGVVQCVRRGQRVAVGTQTNSQADDPRELKVGIARLRHQVTRRSVDDITCHSLLRKCGKKATWEGQRPPPRIPAPNLPIVKGEAPSDDGYRGAVARGGSSGARGTGR